MKATLYGMSHPLGTRKLPVEFPVEMAALEEWLSSFRGDRSRDLSG